MYQKTNKSLEKALQLIEVVANRRQVGVSEVAEITGWPKSNCHKIIETWAKYGYITQNPENRKYGLGWRFLEIGAKALHGYDALRLAAGPVMAALNKKTGENVNLAILDGRLRVYVDRVQSDQVLRPELRIGDRAEAHQTAVGKCLLAQLSDEEITGLYSDEDLSAATPYSVISRKALMLEVSSIRRLGYSTDFEESSMGVNCVAAPVFDYSGVAQAAVSVSAPSQRMDRNRIIAVVPLLLDAAAEISAKLGYRQKEEDLTNAGPTD